LPSKNNKGRDKFLYPTTPIKQSEVFKKSEAATMTIPKLMAASTPVVATKKANKSSFGDVSRIDESVEESVNDDSLEIFADNSELFNVRWFGDKLGSVIDLICSIATAKLHAPQEDP
jgi:hypothetical protein